MMWTPFIAIHMFLECSRVLYQISLPIFCCCCCSFLPMFTLGPLNEVHVSKYLLSTFFSPLNTFCISFETGSNFPQTLCPCYGKGKNTRHCDFAGLGQSFRLGSEESANCFLQSRFQCLQAGSGESYITLTPAGQWEVIIGNSNSKRRKTCPAVFPEYAALNLYSAVFKVSSNQGSNQVPLSLGSHVYNRIAGYLLGQCFTPSLFGPLLLLAIGWTNYDHKA